ncbi:FtsK/SpoIIIE domain-containing protein [Niallia sp. MER 6]|uniref:FtsK/SpoIIIE domain-containing protein n=1 Tax=Niallia sp. MER 6 TaxID=2939567 RepID=UPI00203EB15B|nr:FtsK/SpoIIIE domain-containing protein [Niallia sp. MER 6]MCM3032823.1 FtsK/SpoIIIE domain-containing protein [Niallia sp. MER 6]
MNFWLKLSVRKKLINAFRSADLYKTIGDDRKLYPRIHSVVTNENSTQITFSLLNGMNPDLLKKNFYVFQQYFGSSIELEGEIKKFTLTTHQQSMPSDLTYNFADIQPVVSPFRLGIICGKDRNGEYHAFDLLEQPHILIAGATGSGKSTQIRSILTTLIKTKRPEELQLFLGDCKRSEFHLFRKVEHVQCVYSSARDIERMLLKISLEMERRSKLTELYEVDHIDDLPPEQRCPYWVVCIDEFVMLRKNEEIMSMLTEIVAIGRTLGVIALLSMQRPHSKVLDTTIRANLTVSMGFKLRDRIESNIVNTPNAEKIEVKGRFIMNSDKIREIQAPYLTMDKAKKLLNPFMVMKEQAKEVKPEEPKQLTEEDVFNGN